MSLEGTYTATVDRVESGLAVLLVEDDGETVAERHLPAEELPEGATEGSVCELTVEAGAITAIEADTEATAARRDRLREKFDRLSERLDGDADGE